MRGGWSGWVGRGVGGGGGGEREGGGGGAGEVESPRPNLVTSPELRWDKRGKNTIVKDKYKGYPQGCILV